ncbi:MAG: hypothetical protein ACKO24_03845 [Leptolyngbyaceae cyanobacterium]
MCIGLVIRRFHLHSQSSDAFSLADGDRAERHRAFRDARAIAPA